MSEGAPGAPEMSVEEFEKLSRRAPEPVRLEFIGGKVREKPPADGTHGQIVMWLMRRCLERRADLWLYPTCGLAIEAYRKGRARPGGDSLTSTAVEGTGSGVNGRSDGRRPARRFPMSATTPAVPPPAPTVIGVPAPQEDVDAIVAFVAGVQEAQLNADPDAFLGGFRADAIWTTAHGKRLTGLPEISAFTRKVLPPQADSPVIATYTADLILFIRPDIAAVKIRQRPARRADGAYLDEIFHGQEDPAELMAAHPEAVPGTPTYVLAKDDGVWRIAAAQNTQVLDVETLTAG